MPSYLSPGVYIEEVSSGVKPITGVGTSTGAFVGIAEKGEIGKAKKITSWSEFTREFGGFVSDRYLAYAVFGFFAEGGTTCYIVRTCHYNNIQDPKSKAAKTSAATLLDDVSGKCLRVTASSEGIWGDKLIIRAEKASDGDGFMLKVCSAKSGNIEEKELESFDKLFMKNVEDIINNKSKLIRVEKDGWMEPGGSTETKGTGNPPQVAKAATAVLVDNDGRKCLRVTASANGVSGNALSIRTETDTAADSFKVAVYSTSATDPTKALETFEKLKMAEIENIINNKSKYIQVEKSWKEGDTPTGSGKIPKTAGSEPSGASPYFQTNLTGGNDGVTPLTSGDDGLVGLIYSDFIGDESAQNGLHAFDVVDDINLVAIPDAAKDAALLPGVITDALNYCRKRRDCFYIADSPLGISPTEVKTFKTFNSSFGAMYYPWVLINNPLDGKQIAVPPSGVVAGTYAYTDSARGVHKAPAGTEEGKLDSVVGVKTIVTKGEHDLLNPAGINVIRPMPAGICIWGARTLSMDTEWLYINVRRLFLYIEESIDKGSQWVVFEPNDPSLWSKVKRNLTAFLTRVWRSGALFGSTPEEAFFVKVDEENNPESLRDLGQLNIEVGVAPVKPAEFVIIRISQKTLAK